MVSLITATMSGSVFATSNVAITSGSTVAYTVDGNEYKISTGKSDPFGFYVGSSFYACSPNPNGQTWFQVIKPDGTGGGSTNYNMNGYNSTYNLYYNSNGTAVASLALPSGATASMSTYSSVNEGLAAVRSYIDTPQVVNYSSKKVEAGNVAILDFGNGVFDYDLTLTSYNYQKSGLFQGANAWNENGQAYYWSFTLPESGDSLSGTQITWDKAPSELYPRDALGQTHYGISEMSGTGAARYLLIINPYVNKISESGQGDVNGWINIEGIPEGVGIYIYPLNQTITGLSNENVISTTTDNPGGYGVATSQGGIVDTTTIGGDTQYTQTTGGANSSMPLATIGDYVEDINNTLNGFSQNFLNLLKAPIEYIKALVEGAQNFFQFIGGLFSWLPEEVGAFVITGLMVVVVVGIFHSLL